MRNPPNLDLLQSRALRLPRRKRSAMIESLRTAPQRALRYGVFVDDLANAMIRAYTLGYRKNGSTLRRETRTAKLADYRKRARVVLQQYQVSANKELKRIFRESIKRGNTPARARDLVIRRFRTLGMTAPASNRMETLFKSAMYSAFQQGLWDASRNDAAVWGYRFLTRDDEKVRHPTHSQYHGVTLEKEHSFWDRVWPPLEWNCRCRIQIFRRKQKIVRPPANPIPIETGFQGQDFILR